MANENGHIYAPVSVDEVRVVLGESSTDVGTLCMSKKINPYSLIRPMPVGAPWIGVKEMKVQHLGDLPSSVGNEQWEYKQWGYQVPYVRGTVYLDEILEMAWRRPDADESHYKNIDHFDGYLHNIQPVFYWNVGSVGGKGELVSEEEIIVILGFGLPQIDVVSSSGVKNNGGCVSVLEVFGGEEFYYGVRIKHSTYTNYFFSKEALTSESIPMGVIETGMKAVAGRRYEFTPFITNLPVETANPRDLKFYNLKFAPDYVATKILTCAERTVSVGLRGLEWSDDNELQLGYLTKVEIVVTNQFDYAFEINNLRLYVTEHGVTEGAIGGSAYPREYSVGLLDTIRVGAKGSVHYEWDLGNSLRWLSPITSTYARVRCGGTLQSNYGSKEIEPFWLEMRNPYFYDM